MSGTLCAHSRYTSGNKTAQYAFWQSGRMSPGPLTVGPIVEMKTGAWATMATDYDAPRKQDEELKEDSLEQLKARRSEQQSGAVDEDEVEAAEGFELPGADLSNVELSVNVVPAQDDEFTCSQCFLVHHRSQLAYEENGLPVCTECAA